MEKKLTIVIALVALVLISGIWYIYFANTQEFKQEFVQPNDDTTTGISKDLNELPNDSSINSEMNSLDKSIQNF